LGGRPPVSVNMHWRRFRIDTIPIDDSAAFDVWLRDRWTEKDKLLGIFYRTGRFPADKGVDKATDGKVRRGAGHIETEVKSVRWYEFLQIFAPIGLFALVLYMFYGAMPKQLFSSADEQLSCNTMNPLQKALIGKPRKPATLLPSYPSSKSNTGSISATTRKVTPKVGISGSQLGKATGKTSLKTTTTRTIPAQTTSQEKKVGESQQTRLKDIVAVAKNRPIKPRSGKTPLMEFKTAATKKDTTKLPGLKCESQLARRQVESRPGSSAPKKLGSQIMKSKHPIHSTKLK
jgi:hypothetical protein